MNKVLARLYLIFLVTVTASGQTDVFLKIQSSETRKINVAVADFSTNQNPQMAADLRKIIIDNLNYSGYLAVVDSASAAEGDLFIRDPEILISGNVNHKSSRFSFEFSLT
ncbi:MAG: hypothetical protein PHG61_10685, partial [Candidatus Marinimicrobia bacterium]|nr:hypothetical protein [Candidatus Neomarinimicrobiota bacterium]